MPQPVARPHPVPRTTSPSLAGLRARPETADDFWARVLAAGTPVVEGAGDSRTYTFVHRGEASCVALVANKMADDTSYREVLFERIPGTDLWALALTLGAAWRGSYRIAVVDDSPPTLASDELALLERRRLRSRSVLPAARHTDIDTWFAIQRHARRDMLAREQGPRESIASGPKAPERVLPSTGAAAGHVLLAGPSAWWHVPPASPGPEGLDLLVLLDGDRWRAAGPGAVAALTRYGSPPPTATLLLGHGGVAERTAELTCNSALVARIRDLLATVPLEVGTITADPVRSTIAGQSMGGLAALHALCSAPDRFGAAVCQSGSFWWPNPASGEPAEWLTRTIAATGTRLGRVHLEVGSGEWVLLDTTRRLRDVLQDRCTALSYREFDGGHDSACWDVDLPHALHAVRPTQSSAR